MLSVSFWVGSNFILRLVGSNLTLFVLRSTYASAILMLFCIFQFSYYFPKNVSISKLNQKIAVAISVFVVSVSFTSFFVTSYSEKEKIIEPSYGKGFDLFLVFTLALVALIIRNLWIQYKNATALNRRQLIFISIGFVVSALLSTTTDLILPALTQNSTSANFGPLGSIFLLGFSAYAVTKHNLFNTRVILSEIWAILLTVAIFIWLIVHFSIGNLLGFLFIASICILFVRSVVSEAEKEEKLARANNRLEKDKKDLTRLDRMKDEFLMVATHELTTPIAAIRGKFDMAISENMAGLNDDQKNFFVPAFDATNRLNHLQQELLSTVRIDQNKLVINAEPFLIESIIEEVVNDFKEDTQEKQIKLTCNLSFRGKQINIDVKKIKEVVTNLIDNAIRFTDKGEITIESKLDDTGHSVIVSITDTGVGISNEFKKDLFEKFVQSNRFDLNKPHEQQGIGLGLYISKHIVELHGGKIWCDSTIGKGSTFFFSLPITE